MLYLVRDISLGSENSAVFQIERTLGILYVRRSRVQNAKLIVMKFRYECTFKKAYNVLKGFIYNLFISKL